MAQKKQAYVAELGARFIRDIRHGRAASRLELARRHQLAPSTAGIHIDRLIAQGCLTEEAASNGSHRGRPALKLRLRGDVGVFVGVEFEARSLHATAIDFAGQVLRHEQAAIAEGTSAEKVLELIGQTITAIKGDKLLGIGVGSPGLVDPVAGVARHYRFITGWNDVPLVAHLHKQFGGPVLVENNVRATTLGIQLFEKSARLDDFVCVLIRSGVGAGLMREGRLHAGATHTAGEIGRIPQPSGGATLEDLTSLPAILRYAKENAGRFPDSKFATIQDLISASRRGDSLARAALGHAIGHLGWLCHLLALVENPPAIVFAGPLAELGEWLRVEIEAAAGEYAQVSKTQLPRIFVTGLGENVGALGAASLAVEAWKP